jgi:hypothetical protein
MCPFFWLRPLKAECAVCKQLRCLPYHWVLWRAPANDLPNDPWSGKPATDFSRLHFHERACCQGCERNGSRSELPEKIGAEPSAERARQEALGGAAAGPAKKSRVKLPPPPPPPPLPRGVWRSGASRACVGARGWGAHPKRACRACGRQSRWTVRAAAAALCVAAVRCAFPLQTAREHARSSRLRVQTSVGPFPLVLVCPSMPPS